MFNILFLIIGLVFASSASFYAKRKNMHAENWFTLGLFFWFFALIALYFIHDSDFDAKTDTEENEGNFPHPYSV